MIDQLGRAGSANPEIIGLKNEMAKLLAESSSEKKEFLQKLTELEVFIKVLESKTGEGSDEHQQLVAGNSQFDFFLKVILLQTSALVLLISIIGVAVLLKCRSREFLSSVRNSSSRVEVADTD